MAVVLNDLLGISNPNRASRTEERIEQFPSYEEFWATRNEVGNPTRDNFAYDERTNEESQNYNRSNQDYAYNLKQFSDRNEYRQNDFADRNEYRQNDFADRKEYNNYNPGYNQNKFSYGVEQSVQSRESENDKYYGSKCVSSSVNDNYFHENVQAYRQNGNVNACLYSVRDELSSVSDSQYEDNLYEKLAYNSPLASNQQMRISTRRTAAEPTVRKTHKASRLNLKGKVILAVYIALAVLMTTLIAVNAASFNGSGLNASAGNSVSYTETATEVETQATSTSAVVSNSIQNEKFGYVTNEFNYAENTNWFDRFCDSLGNLFK